ncbi:MAG TPA: hypothetical protein VFU02_19160 [Polyangiaceae bacterium]|nr:hypothetical protein [Polyangiaceae bacterium]
MTPRSPNTEPKKPVASSGGASGRDTNAQRGGVTHHDAAEVQHFLDRFAKAMTSGDAKAVARLWEAPAFVIDEHASIAVPDLDAVERFFAGAKDQYNAQGITTTKAEILDLDWVTDNLVVARVRWPYLDDSGKSLGAESSSYTLKRNADGELKLRVVLMRGVEESAPAAKHGKN